MEAGRLDRRLAFFRRQEIQNGAGGTRGDWVYQFTMAANVKPMRGGESVLAARLEARGPAIVTVRTCANTRQLTAEWKAVDTRSSREYAVRETPRHPVDKEGREDRAFLEMLVEAGVAA